MLAVVLAFAALQPAAAQIVRLGSCQNYIGDGNFDISYIHTLTDEPLGFYIAVTSGPTDRRCQRIKFAPSGTYEYSYYDRTQELRNFSGTYSADPSTFTSLGSITLQGLPVGELGAGLTRRVQLKVVMAEPRRILVASCIPFGVANSAQVHALIPASQYTASSAVELINHLKVRQFPHQSSLLQTSQLCYEATSTGVEDNLVRRLDVVEKAASQPAPNVPRPFAILSSPMGAAPQARHSSRFTQPRPEATDTFQGADVDADIHKLQGVKLGNAQTPQLYQTVYFKP